MNSVAEVRWETNISGEHSFKYVTVKERILQNAPLNYLFTLTSTCITPLYSSTLNHWTWCSCTISHVFEHLKDKGDSASSFRLRIILIIPAESTVPVASLCSGPNEPLSGKLQPGSAPLTQHRCLQQQLLLGAAVAPVLSIISGTVYRDRRARWHRHSAH